MLELVSVKGKCREGGTCAHCGSDNAASERYRILGKYQDSPTEPYIVEPFNLCKECYEVILENGKLTDDIVSRTATIEIEGIVEMVIAGEQIDPETARVIATEVGTKEITIQVWGKQLPEPDVDCFSEWCDWYKEKYGDSDE